MWRIMNTPLDKTSAALIAVSMVAGAMLVFLSTTWLRSKRDPKNTFWKDFCKNFRNGPGYW